MRTISICRPRLRSGRHNNSGKETNESVEGLPLETEDLNNNNSKKQSKNNMFANSVWGT